jgi:phytoene synthase
VTVAGLAYCRDKAAPEGSSLHYATLFHAEPARRGLFALFALYHELLDGFLAASDPGVARIKLQWWREELDRLEAGNPRHPVSEELLALTGAGGVETAELNRLPDAVEALFPVVEPGNLETWLDRPDIGRFWRMTARLAAKGDPPAAAETGILLSRLELLQQLPPLLRLGINPLPEPVLAAHGLDRDRLLAEPAAAAGLAAELVDAIVTRLDEAYRRGKAGDPLFILILNRLGATLCREIRRDGYALLQRRVALTPIRKLWIAARTRYARALA